MHHEFERHQVLEYNERERAQFAALPRESELNPMVEHRIVSALKSEGYFTRRSRFGLRLLQAAAALIVFAAGGVVGRGIGMRNSLEVSLERKDLNLTDRVLLLQRAGTAYIRAANGYADATSHVDSAAVEVARGVLVGAAQAVARRSLDGGMTTRLVAAMQSPGATH